MNKLIARARQLADRERTLLIGRAVELVHEQLADAQIERTQTGFRLSAQAIRGRWLTSASLRFLRDALR